MLKTMMNILLTNVTLADHQRYGFINSNFNSTFIL